jgi:hypothetical protein
MDAASTSETSDYRAQQPRRQPSYTRRRENLKSLKQWSVLMITDADVRFRLVVTDAEYIKTDRQIEVQIDRYTDRQTDKQIDRGTDRQIYRQTDKQIDVYIHPAQCGDENLSV